MASQPHHITSDSVYNSLKYKQVYYCYTQIDAQNDVQKKKNFISLLAIQFFILLDEGDYFLPNQLPLLFVDPHAPVKLL